MRPIVVSLGAGVQSSAMLLMALEGRFGRKPDCAVFADTHWEPQAVYRWLERLEKTVAPFEVVRVSGGDIRLEGREGGPWSRRDGSPFVTLPVYSRQGLSWSAGQGRRQCTKEYKLVPVQRFVRERFGEAEVWVGISTDEAHRAKPSRVGYVQNRWPLLEAGLSRRDCEEYLIGRMGESAPKSSCIGCPFKTDGQWAAMRRDDPESFEGACRFDEELRNLDPSIEQFLHRSLQPLRTVEFRHENQHRMFLDEFGNECEGVCGV